MLTWKVGTIVSNKTRAGQRQNLGLRRMQDRWLPFSKCPLLRVNTSGSSSTANGTVCAGMTAQPARTPRTRRAHRCWVAASAPPVCPARDSSWTCCASCDRRADCCLGPCFSVMRKRINKRGFSNPWFSYNGTARTASTDCSVNTEVRRCAAVFAELTPLSVVITHYVHHTIFFYINTQPPQQHTHNGRSELNATWTLCCIFSGVAASRTRDARIHHTCIRLSIEYHVCVCSLLWWSSVASSRRLRHNYVCVCGETLHNQIYVPFCVITRTSERHTLCAK